MRPGADSAPRRRATQPAFAQLRYRTPSPTAHMGHRREAQPDWQHGSAKPSSLAVLRGIRDAGEHVRNTAESVKQICHSSGKIDEVNYSNRHDVSGRPIAISKFSQAAASPI